MGSELIYGGHDGLSLAESDGYTSKPEKRLLWLLRPLRYLLREQRLLFMLVGVALATLVFAFAPASPSPSAAELIRHDVVEPLLLEVDQIYHLACPASPVHYKY
ncbi:hypothetical protein GW17_00030980, partial [Ensete ventricosum]